MRSTVGAAQPLDFAQTGPYSGYPILRVCEEWEPECGGEGFRSGENGAKITVVDSIVPALAKSARTGHPEFRKRKAKMRNPNGWATRPP